MRKSAPIMRCLMSAIINVQAYSRLRPTSTIRLLVGIDSDVISCNEGQTDSVCSPVRARLR